MEGCWRSVSPVSPAPLAQIIQGLVGKRIEAACRDILFNLAVLRRSVGTRRTRSDRQDTKTSNPSVKKPFDFAQGRLIRRGYPHSS